MHQRICSIRQSQPSNRTHISVADAQWPKRAVSPRWPEWVIRVIRPVFRCKKWVIRAIRNHKR